MVEYTICFLKQGDKILLLNRDKPQWMGAWNGVGGKIEQGETPLVSALREIKEETGIALQDITYKGKITWTDGNINFGCMYAFMAELPESYPYVTPIKVAEGILDWKDLSWILHPQNVGIADLKYYLPKMLDESINYEYIFTYKDSKLIDMTSTPLVQAFTV
ncbi:NUDIX hydrolase [Lysinibacillus pakistanensis]|uniref:8-oxo-dGTP diphosphatase n=1 Tax=Lysinibacillus pakistanensis TaxID=759811 RepID=A0AAX3X060_9BACI|nr:8-oxo-dGTP diphosphatase [Lysinibacillus pakistanensis]MDM5232471.1 8-oxo-dGTP diphosphatase [Lysinibacillus pakistanensis]WHY47982.1 8-oxo-dGTP diphosphatase [Lysinibacillus pakistanensis]WHY52994.1 8-oxo-dGTP diphosphatase [Lysinibacillus pakistanensis]